MTTRRPRRFLLSLSASLLALVVSVTPAMALTWGPVVPISDAGTANAWSYAMAAGASKVFIAYRELDDEDRHIAFRRSGDGGATFGEPIEISRPEASTSFQASLSYAGVFLHAAWVEASAEDGSDERGWYRRSPDGGLTWGEPKAMTSSGVTSVTSPRVFASGSRVFFAYTDGVTGQVWVRRSVDSGATFGSRKLLGNSTNEGFAGSTVFDGSVSMAFGTGVTYAVWRSSSRGVKLRRSTDGGVTWKSSVTIATRAGSDPIVAAAGSSAQIVTSYYDASTVEYVALRRTTNKGATWTARKRISTVPSRHAFSPRVMRANGLWRLAYTQCGSGGCDVSRALWYRSSKDGVTWSTPQRFSATAPDIRAVGLGYTSTNKRFWVAWTSWNGLDPDLDVYLRGGK